ncbi:hypothetical protein CSPHI_02400 [Corynebacterium sphenisci DSM 44792]|uniref:Uncharacterized protein n=1 Tax=Corynebacterium sphenisci DSM 44792 TaxID=1437874 RepID=A0A1L7CWC6_9CORY|nr:hypothetical protein [Corynebacterium sphenisci]APT90110.1 hypothetical protein CSPHI_02400 [Corynebacterium sphenisci DSM 44792]
MRRWPEFLLLQPVAVGMALIGGSPLPHPFGLWVEPQVRVGAFLPLLEVVAVGLLLRSRWSRDYEEAVTAGSTVLPRAVVLAVAAVVAAVPWAVLLVRGVPASFVVMTVGWLGLGVGVLLLGFGPAGPAWAIPVAAAVAGALAAGGWFPAVVAVLGDGLGAGRPVWAPVVDLLVLAAGVAAHLRRGAG